MKDQGPGEIPARGGRDGRARTLGAVRDAGEPVSATDIAERLGLHVSTVRFHLDRLVRQGLVERRTERRGTRGRPRVVHSPAAEAGPRSYQLLATMLSGLVSALTSDHSAAREAGRAWGRHLVERPAPSTYVDTSDALRRLLTLLDEVGFEPELREGLTIDLANCPFREVAEGHQDLVCSLHLGLMQGALDEVRAPLEAHTLRPFVTPRRCVAELRGSAVLS